MLIAMMGMMDAMNLPSNLFPMLLGAMLGQQPENTVITGVGMHLFASLVIGAIFGLLKFSLVMKLISTNPSSVPIQKALATWVASQTSCITNCMVRLKVESCR